MNEKGRVKHVDVRQETLEAYLSFQFPAKYYYCISSGDSWQVDESSCNEGLVFNPENNVCDWPYNVDDSVCNGDGGDGGEATDAPPPPTTTTAAAPPATTTPAPPATTTAAPPATTTTGGDGGGKQAS